MRDLRSWNLNGLCWIDCVTKEGTNALNILSLFKLTELVKSTALYFYYIVALVCLLITSYKFCICCDSGKNMLVR